MMYIHCYDRRTGRGFDWQDANYPYACAFYPPHGAQYQDMCTWVAETYEPSDYRGRIDHGELFFDKPEHAAWFVLRWS